MIPKKVKDMALFASRNRDKNVALEVCDQITNNDLYINVPKPEPTRNGMYTVARWANRPCKCGCGTMIEPGTKVWWEPNWGISIPGHVGK